MVDTPTRRAAAVGKLMRYGPNDFDTPMVRESGDNVLAHIERTARKAILAVLDYVRPINPEAVRRFVYMRGHMAEARKACRELHEGGRGFWYANVICVHPDSQGKGLARMLLTWVMDRAERDGVPLFLEATAAGYPVYRKLGFEDYGEIVIEDPRVPIVMRPRAMIYWPSSCVRA